MKVKINTLPLFDFNKQLSLVHYKHAKSNQTISSLIDNRITLDDFRELFESANIVSLTKTNEEPFDIKNLPILNGEIGLWMIKQRNISSKIPESSKKIFVRNISNVLKGFDMEKILPDPCMDFVVQNSTITNKTLPRAFQGFFRIKKGIGLDEDEIAKLYSKGIEEYVTNVVGKDKNALWSKQVKIKYKKATTHNKKLFQTILMAFRIGTELPVEGLIKTLEENTIYKRDEIQKHLDWANQKRIIIYTNNTKDYMKRI